MAVHPWWANYIARGSVARGLDPQAVLRVAGAEGLSGGVGDSGHAFGPFQLNDAGGVITNRPGNHRAFAESKQGIDFALNEIAKVAKGLKGDAAVRAIVTRFERPADPQGEIARATGAPAPSYAPAGGLTALGGGAGRDVLSQGVTEAQQGAADIRSQARQNLHDIAMGTVQPTEALAKLPGLQQGGTPTAPVVFHPPNMQTGSLEAKAVNLAKKYIGVKYTWGGESVATGFDCSGLVQNIWKTLGVNNVPRTTYAQWDAGTPVDSSQIAPGDAVFFTGSDPQDGKPGHEGLYIGNGKFIEAPGSGKTVRISTLAGRSDFVGARRFG